MNDWERMNDRFDHFKAGICPHSLSGSGSIARLRTTGLLTHSLISIRLGDPWNSSTRVCVTVSGILYDSLFANDGDDPELYPH